MRKYKLKSPQRLTVNRFYIVVADDDMRYLHQDGEVREFSARDDTVYFNCLTSAEIARKQYMTPTINLSALYNHKELTDDS